MSLLKSTKNQKKRKHSNFYNKYVLSENKYITKIKFYNTGCETTLAPSTASITITSRNPQLYGQNTINVGLCCQIAGTWVNMWCLKTLILLYVDEL